VASALTVAVGGLALVVFALFGVVLELHRDVRQLRDAAGILDRPLEVALDELAGARPSSYGFPPSMDGIGAAVILFLSDRCGTCHALARGLAGSLPGGLWVVLEARSAASAAEFLANHHFDEASTEGRLLVDVDGRIAQRMGLRTTPVGFRVENGRFVSATTVPSRRYLLSIISDRIRLEQSAPLPTAEGRAQ
jgi:hypothetical protein